MVCFIKKIFENRIDESVHRQFVRFSRGSFAGRAALSFKKGENLKLGGSFEFANDFVDFVSETGNWNFSGIILSREQLDFPGKPKSGIYKYNVENVGSEKIKEIRDKAYSMLLDVQGDGMKLTMKKKLPKPGKSGELKIDDKFCIIECDLKYWEKMRMWFMLSECGKKFKVNHTYIIEDVIVDRNEKDFVKMRENAKKKGKIIRKMEVDGKELREEKSFEA